MKCEQVQQRPAQYYLGVHLQVSLQSLPGDMGWESAQFNSNIKVLEQVN